MADSNRIRVSYQIEDDWGNVRDTVPFQEIFLTGGSLSSALETVRSATVRSDSQAAGTKRTAVGANATLNFELSPGDYDSLFRVVARSTDDWSSDWGISTPRIEVVSVGTPGVLHYRRQAGFFDGSMANHWGYFANFAESENNGWKRIEDVVSREVGALNTAINDSATAIVLSAAATLMVRVGDALLIDDEVVIVTAVTSQTQFTVSRAGDGTTAAAHEANAAVSLYNIDLLTSQSDELAAEAIPATTPPTKTIQGSWIENGAELFSIAIQEQFSDLTDRYLLARGMRVPAISLDLSTGAIITGSLTCEGADVVQRATRAGSALTPASGNDVMSEVDSFGNVWLDGEIRDTGFDLLALSFSFTSNARPQAQLGQLARRGIGMGAFTGSGSMQIYLGDQSWDVLGDLFSFTKQGFAFDLEDVTGARYLFEFPRIAFSGEPGEIPGTDSDKTLSMEFGAEPGIGNYQKTLQINRVVAP